MMPTQKIEYVIFDMDGLMIDSEKVYTDVTNEILAPFGKAMTWDIKAGCMGKPDRAAAAHLLSFFPDIPITLEEYLVQRDIAQDRRWPTVQLLPGVEKLVKHLHAHKIPIAVATGSRRKNYEMKTAHLQDVFGCFDGKVVCGDDHGGTIRGKPNPDVFVLAARELLNRPIGTAADVACSEAEMEERRKGLVFEDAIPGMQAGKRAGMAVVWVPDAQLLDVEYSGQEKPDETLKSLEEFVPQKWGLPPFTET